MKIKFYKYQGTGNDFILIDNRSEEIQLSNPQIALLCDRKHGIGADGLMLIQNQNGFDFKMLYYNSDGKESSMCGNGGRCIVACVEKLGLKKKEYQFIAIDGPHSAKLKQTIVELQMKDVEYLNEVDQNFILNTGSPHFVIFSDQVREKNVFEEGQKIRYSLPYKKEGINVNFVEVLSSQKLFVRTYERGVENETLSCGTGVTAAALAHAKKTDQKSGEIQIITPGGELSVKFKSDKDGFKDIYLSGPAQFVFFGEINL
jgi:diaminopimelate epimerase